MPPKATVRIAWYPDDRLGMWMYHCHILEHHAAGNDGALRGRPVNQIRSVVADTRTSDRASLRLSATLMLLGQILSILLNLPWMIWLVVVAWPMQDSTAPPPGP